MSTPRRMVSPAELFALDGGEALATGELSIRQVVPVASISEDGLLALVARARCPEHAPITRALAAAVKERVSPSSHQAPASPQDSRDPDRGWRLAPHQGITGSVGGFDLLIGTERFVEDAGIVIAEPARRVLAEHERLGWASVLVSASCPADTPQERHRSLIGILAFGAREEASVQACDRKVGGALPAANPERTWVTTTWATVLWHFLSAIFTRLRGRRRRCAALLICASGLAGTLLSLVAVGPDEAAIVQRFGRAVAYCGPGLHLRPLWAVETIIRIRPRRERTVRIGMPFRPTSLSGQDTDLPISELVLTGDVYAPTGPRTYSVSNHSARGKAKSASQLLRIDAQVQYAISDLHAFVFGNRDPDALVAISAESVLRELIGSRSMLASLGPQRGELTTRGKKRLQDRLEALGCGVLIRAIVLDDLQPAPGTGTLNVAEAFEQVARADAEQAEAIAQAGTECDHLIGQARARAAQIQAVAHAEQVRAIEAARARSEWVRAHHAPFRRAPERFRRQMLIDLIAGTASGGRTIVLDPTLNDATRVLLEIAEPARPLSPDALENHGASESAARKGGRP